MNPMNPTGDDATENRTVSGRIIFIFVVVSVLVIILLLRLGYLQISQHQKYTTLAQNNSIDFFALPPVRGLIYDRNGAVIAQNVRAFNLEILPDKVENIDDLLTELGQIIELTEAHLKRFRRLMLQRPAFERQTLKANLNEQEAAILAVNLNRYRGAELRARLQRHYPQGTLTSHLIGYVGRINPTDMKNIDRQAYRGLEYIGKTGIEAYYESILLGKSGLTQVETNAHGRIVRSLEQTDPQTGKTLHLSVDIKLQQKSIEALAGLEGSVVAIEPQTGDVLAFASVPGYDPNLFVNGISEANYAELRTSVRRPLVNRAIYGRYAPGSTIKGFMSLVGMENGVNPSETVFCPGWYRLPNRKHRYRCWKKPGHGRMDGFNAIVQSCDVYFYNLARKLGIDKMYEGMTRFGFGKASGIDMLDEPTALMPSRAWKRRVRDQVWYPGETIIAGIGQGYMLVTPLQLANATAILANRGRKITPRFLSAIEHPQSQVREYIAPKTTTLVKLRSERYYQTVIDSMRDVVHGARGTARGINRGIRYKMAGKTGTAQVKSIAQDQEYDEATTEKKFRDHSLFIGFAPLDDPKIAIAVVIEHGGSGSRVAAPIARKLIDYYLLDRLKLFNDPDTHNLVGQP